MARLFVICLTIYNNKICSIAYKICQNQLKVLPKTKCILSKWPKYYNCDPKWRKFAKSGHTEFKSQLQNFVFKAYSPCTCIFVSVEQDQFRVFCYCSKKENNHLKSPTFLCLANTKLQVHGVYYKNLFAVTDDTVVGEA